MDPIETEKENMQYSEGNVRPQRNINLTEKGQEHFENLKEPYLARIADTWGTLEDRLNCVDGAQDYVEELLNLHAEIQKLGPNLKHRAWTTYSS
jgi:DNA-binding MarR family transcriptional regulator